MRPLRGILTLIALLGMAAHLDDLALFITRPEELMIGSESMVAEGGFRYSSVVIFVALNVFECLCFAGSIVAVWKASSKRQLFLLLLVIAMLVSYPMY